MILKTASWNTASMDTATRELGFIDASIVHNFNECAKVNIRIADPIGSKLQKYDSDAAGDEIYVGSGKALLYDINGNCVFNGRILAAERVDKILTLTCEDWMNQLKDERVHYDFREDLDGSGLRESGAHGDLDNATSAYRFPAYTAGASSYFIDDDMSWDIDEWNGYNLVFTGKNSGDIAIELGPYNHAGGDDMTANGWVNCWTDDANNDHFEMDSAIMYCKHYFAFVASKGSLCAAATMKSASILARIKVVEGANYYVGLRVGVYQWNLAGYKFISVICNPGSNGKEEKKTIEIPKEWFADMVDSNGIVLVTYESWGTGANPDIEIYWSKLKVLMEGVNTVQTIYPITDTLRNPADTGATYNTLKSATATIDYGVNGVGIWEGFKYSIVKELYNRINGIVTGGDPLVTLTTSVEALAGITTWHASDRTRFEILQYVAPIDKAVFWVPLGTTQVNWKNTTDAAATVLKDRNVLRWFKTRYDMSTMANQTIIYGARIGDEEVTYTYDAATSQADYDFVKTEVVRDVGISSNYEAKSYGTALAAQRAKIPLSVSAELVGLSSIRLGDWIEVTSTLLGITAGNYIVDRWEYSGDTTKIRLQPKTSDGYIVFREFSEEFRDRRALINETKRDKFVGDLTTQTWVN